MKSGFLLSNDPKISLLTQKPTKYDETIGKRKYKYDDFDFERNIGNGNFCNVWHVTLKTDPLISYAIKSYNIQNVTSKDQQMFVKQEKAALLRLNTPGHKNVIKLIDTFRDEYSVYLIYEHAEGGELWERIKHCGSIFDGLAIHYIIQILDGLEYIHSKGLVHRDLKCENIVISNDILKIIDFGTSMDCNVIESFDNQKNTNNFIKNNMEVNKDNENKNNLENNNENKDNKNNSNNENKDNKNNSNNNIGNIINNKRINSRRFEHYVGTPNFMDPHSLSNKDTGFKRDLWSLGCIIYQILCGRPPFYGSTEYFILKNIKEYNLKFPPTLNQYSIDLIKTLLNTDPNKRPDLSEVRSHPFFNQIQNSENIKELEDMCKEPRKICYDIGKLLIDLEENRSPEINKEFNDKFNKYINMLKQQINKNNEHVIYRLIDLMYWHLEETKKLIINENEEANKWLS